MDDRPPLSKEDKLELARRVFREWFARCFWSSDPNATIEEKDIPFVIAGLRRNGGHDGYRIASDLCR